MIAHAGQDKVAGIGVDILRVERIEQVFARHGQKFVQRILGPQEIEKFHRRYQRDPQRGIRFLATRFAAKEAFSKAIGLGMHSPMAWSRMQTLNEASGKPMVKLSDPLDTWYRKRFGAAHVSITDESDTVMAFVIVETLPTIPKD
ncbi:MAG TPA: holo-ACP synthase [Candidimonas sp.]|nr:holo-ACP synthase [Candidimonas sp.]